MILASRPKIGAIMAASKKPDFVEEMGPIGPPEFDMASYAKDGVEMAAERLIAGIKSGHTQSVISALRNLIALMDCADDMTSSEY